jgi:hypothetical protein
VYFIVVKVWAYDPTILQIHLAPLILEDEKVCAGQSNVLTLIFPRRIKMAALQSWSSKFKTYLVS